MSGGNPFLDALWRIQEREELTARGLSELLGVTEASVSRWRSGQRKLGGEMVQRIVRVYPELLDSLLVEEPPDRRVSAR